MTTRKIKFRPGARLRSAVLTTAILAASLVSLATPAHAGVVGVQFAYDQSPGNGAGSWAWIWNTRDGRYAYARIRACQQQNYDIVRE